MLRRNTIPELVRLISSSLLLQRSKSSVSQYGFIYNGKIIKVRVSSHPANGEKLDNPNADDVISIVIYKDGEHRGEYGNYTEIIYNPRFFNMDQLLIDVLEGFWHLLTKGNYLDVTGKSQKNIYVNGVLQESNTDLKTTFDKQGTNRPAFTESGSIPDPKIENNPETKKHNAMRPHKKISYINYKGNYDRNTVENSKRQLHYPSVTSACIRGLSNAMPVTMQHYYDKEKGLTGEAGRWNDSDIEEFSAVLGLDIERIKAAIASGLYDTVVLPEKGFSKSAISAVSKERTPILYAQYIKEMKGLNEFIKSWNESAVETILPVSALADPAKFYDVFRTYANSRSKEETRAIFEVIGDAEQQKAFIKAGAEDRGTMVIGKFDAFPDDFKEAVMALWQDNMNKNTV